MEKQTVKQHTVHYQKTPYFKEYYPIIKEAINFNHELLIGLNLHLIKAIAELLGIKAKMMRSSEFPYGGTEKNEKLVSMCKFLGADTYLSGSGGKNYVNETCSAKPKSMCNGTAMSIQLINNDSSGFQPNMSIIDLLFNEGPQAKEILLKGGIIEANKSVETAGLSSHLIVKEAEASLELHYLGVRYAFNFYYCFRMNIPLRDGFFNTVFAHQIHNC